MLFIPYSYPKYYVHYKIILLYSNGVFHIILVFLSDYMGPKSSFITPFDLTYSLQVEVTRYEHK